MSDADRVPFTPIHEPFLALSRLIRHSDGRGRLWAGVLDHDRRPAGLQWELSDREPFRLDRLAD